MSTREVKRRIDSILAELSNRLVQALGESFTEHTLGPQPASRGPQPASRGPAGAKTKSAPKVVSAAGARNSPAASGKRGSAADGRRLPAETRAAAERFAKYVSANPGQRIRQIGPALGMSTEDLALPVSKALAMGWVRKDGQRSATAYFPANGDGAAKSNKGRAT